jgi:hypothetical protein
MGIRVFAFAAMLSLSTPRLDASSIYLTDNTGNTGEGPFIVPVGVYTGATISNPFMAGGTISGLLDPPDGPPDSSYFYNYQAFGIPGALHLSMEASNTNNPDGINQFIYGSETVQGNVDMTMTAADEISVGGNGGSTLRLSYLFDGSLACTGNLGICSGTGQFQVNGGSFTQVLASTNSSPFLIGFVYLPIIDGVVNYSEFLYLMVSCESSFTGDCQSLGNFTNTAMLGDAVVLDANGNIVTGATITSQSGCDYTQPLATTPEPATLGMVAISLTALALRLRKRLTA